MSEQEAPAVTAESTVEPYFGVEGVERAAGYVPLDLEKKEEQPELTIEEAVELRKARQAEAESRTPETEVRTYSPLGDLPDNVTVTAEQAAQIRSEERQAKEKAAEEVANEKLRQETDEKRLLAEADGIIEAANSIPDEVIPDELKPYVEAGLDREVAAAIAKPQVRAALEQEFARADQAREQNTAMLQSGQHMLQATVAALAPQLQSVPIEHWAQAIQHLAQTDPVRAELVADTLDKWGRIQFAQQHEQQRQAETQRQQFEATRQQWSKQSGEALGPMTIAEKMEMANELAEYMGKYGVSREALIQEASTNLALHHPAFQAMFADAIKYQRMVSAEKPRATKAIPPVQKPGTARSTGAGVEHNSSIQALHKQLASATGDRAIKIAAQIRGMRKGRG